LFFDRPSQQLSPYIEFVLDYQRSLEKKCKKTGSIQQSGENIMTEELYRLLFYSPFSRFGKFHHPASKKRIYLPVLNSFALELYFSGLYRIGRNKAAEK
jgi:hypothetical protein